MTRWGERYEVFAECAPLIAGSPATCNAHVTVLDGFKPLGSGSVTILLRGGGPGQAFRQDNPKHDGIFAVELRPSAEGPFDLAFQVSGPAGEEAIPGGRVQVGSASSPGGRIGEGALVPADAVSFLKEQQWRTGFATMAVAEGALEESVSGPARVEPAAGGEVTLTAAFDAAVASSPWPYPGLDVKKGGVVLRLQPRVGGRSLPDLQAEVATLEAETEAARRRVERLMALLRSEATSPAEMERAQATLASLEARLKSARAGAGAGGGAAAGADGGASRLAVVAPWAGRVADVAVTPGQTVSAGAPLARLVKMTPLWIVLALRPEDASRVEGAPAGLHLRRPGSTETLALEAGAVRLVSRAPEIDPRTASVALILEIDRSAADLAIGSAVEADLLLGGGRRGVVIPAAALVDDAGVLVAYVQIEGETFARRELSVLARQGDRALVEGLRPGERLVVSGAAAVRRAALLSSGASEGHVH